VALNPSGVAGTSYLRLRLGSDEEAKLLYSALLPETESVPSDRASTTIAVEGSVLLVVDFCLHARSRLHGLRHNPKPLSHKADARL
jgi:hypothetical protein